MSAMIEAKGLAKSFGRKQVLDNLSFSLVAGEPIALIGPNGAGKTTLFSLLCGYIQPSRGELRIFGHKAGSPELFGKVAALPQDALLDPNFTIRQQFELYGQLQGMSAAQARLDVERVLQLVDLASSIDAKPTALSHGMRKRVAIAQALLGEPALVLLDEPTAGLDPANAMQVRQLVSRLSQQTTFLISSHNLFELEQLCGTVLYLEHGKLLQQPVASASRLGYMTLQLEQAPMIAVMAQVEALPGVTAVKSLQKQELQIEFEPALAGDLDLALLQLLKQQGWRYRQLTFGQTLEQQLFPTAS